MDSHTLSKAELAYFTGSEHQYTNPIYTFLYTDGVRHVAERAGAWWLLDAIDSWSRSPNLASITEGLVTWRLEVDRQPGQVWRPAVLTARTEESGIVIRQQIESTDFPLADVTMWLYDGVLMLPSEW